jgi:hypothetical protein
MSAPKQQHEADAAAIERRDAPAHTSSSGSDRAAGEDLTMMLQQRLAELEHQAIKPQPLIMQPKTRNKNASAQLLEA